MLKFTKFLVMLEKENRIILINKNVGSWIKISKESYQIIFQAIEKNLPKAQLLNAFKNNDDRQYFKQLLDVLKKRKILVPKNDSEDTNVEDISIDFTNRCNLNCIHCMAEANEDKGKKELDTSKYKLLIDKILSVSPDSITISGGEPMVRSDFNELCNYIRVSYTGNLSLMTNGTLISEENVDLLVRNFNNISISLDGIDEESSSILRGNEAFTRAMNGIQLLKKRGFSKISASMVETKINVHLIPKFIEMCKRMNVYPMIRAFAAVGRGEKSKEQLLIRPDYCPDANLLEEYLSAPIENFETHSISGVCSSSINSFYIDAYGNIFPCAPLSSPEYLYDNINNIANFKNYINKREYKKTSGYLTFSSDFPENNEMCSSCEVNTFCWRCIFQHNQKRLNDSNFKTWCNLQKKELDTIWYEE